MCMLRSSAQAGCELARTRTHARVPVIDAGVVVAQCVTHAARANTTITMCLTKMGRHYIGRSGPGPLRLTSCPICEHQLAGDEPFPIGAGVCSHLAIGVCVCVCIFIGCI